MTECDKCGTDTPMTATLRNVEFDNGTITMIRSRMDVCFDCHGEMKESVAWDL